jgi:hypothetical protein
MALLIPADPAQPVRPVNRATKGFAALLGCQFAERWPYQRQLDAVAGPDGHRYRYDIWVDEEGRLRPGAAINTRATIAAHPYAEAYGWPILGDAILVPLNRGATYDADDWDQIWRGVWAFADPDADSEDDESLVAQNASGPLAADVRLQ